MNLEEFSSYIEMSLFNQIDDNSAFRFSFSPFRRSPSDEDCLNSALFNTEASTQASNNRTLNSTNASAARLEEPALDFDEWLWSKDGRALDVDI